MKQEPRRQVCDALAPFGTSIFAEMTALANAHGAVNLSQGFPDFDGPLEIRRLAADALLEGPNQYAPTNGLPALRSAVATSMKRFRGVDVDPDTEVTITAGATEALAATLLGLLNPGDEVILFEPFYDLYPAVVARAGAKAVPVPLVGVQFRMDWGAVERAFTDRTRAILLTNPHNPCGRVFTAEELSFLARLCIRNDTLLIADEVYEHILFDGRVHQTALGVPGLRQRAVVISSTGKTFSLTGWKVGWAVAAPPLTAAVRAAHQFLTFATPGAFQRAMAAAIASDDTYYLDFARQYGRRRERFCGTLERMGLDVVRPEGSYYATLRFRSLGFNDDVQFCRFLATDVGVAAIPMSAFYQDRRGGRDLARLCFCKRDDTLEEAVRRLAAWRKVPFEGLLPPDDTEPV